MELGARVEEVGRLGGWGIRDLERRGSCSGGIEGGGIWRGRLSDIALGISRV